jgi:hypothetical protein
MNLVRAVEALAASDRWGGGPANPWPRGNERWTPAEDDLLLELFDEALARYPGVGASSYRTPGPASDVGDLLGRTTGSVITRRAILMLCKRKVASPPATS